MFTVGIVGAGDIVRKVHLPVLQCLSETRVAWLHDASDTRARAVGGAYQVPVVAARNADELPECDVLLLAVPAPVRASYLETFRRRGAAVFCEKPFAISAQEHRRHLEGFEPHRLGCGYMRRFYNSTATIERLLRQRMLGPLRRIRVAEGGRSRGSGSGQSFLDDPRFAAAGGVLLDLGTHTLDLALQFARASAFDIEACHVQMDGGVDRHAEANIKFPGGIRLDFSVSWLSPQANRMVLDFDHVSLWMGLSPDARVYMGDPLRPVDAIELQGVGGATTFNQAFALEWRDFLAGLVSGRASRVSAHGALLTTALAEDLRRYSRTANG